MPAGSEMRAFHAKNPLLQLLLISRMSRSVKRVGTKGAVGSKTKATNGAFRDAAFPEISRLRGEPPYISKGRWSTTIDQQAFSVNYEQAYATVLSAPSKDMGKKYAEELIPQALGKTGACAEAA